MQLTVSSIWANGWWYMMRYWWKYNIKMLLFLNQSFLQALSFIKEESKSFYLRAVKPIPVSGAFHTSLMSSAQQPISKALDAVTIETPVICIHSNVDGKPYGGPAHIRKQLKRQVVEPVLWEQTMHCIYERGKGTPFPFTYEMGPGHQLGSMLKRNNLKASNSCTNVKVWSLSPMCLDQ